MRRRLLFDHGDLPGFADDWLNPTRDRRGSQSRGMRVSGPTLVILAACAAERGSLDAVAGRPRPGSAASRPSCHSRTGQGVTRRQQRQGASGGDGSSGGDRARVGARPRRSSGRHSRCRTRQGIGDSPGGSGGDWANGLQGPCRDSGLTQIDSGRRRGSARLRGRGPGRDWTAKPRSRCGIEIITQGCRSIRAHLCGRVVAVS